MIFNHTPNPLKMPIRVPRVVLMQRVLLYICIHIRTLSDNIQQNVLCCLSYVACGSSVATLALHHLHFAHVRHVIATLYAFMNIRIFVKKYMFIYMCICINICMYKYMFKYICMYM